MHINKLHFYLIVTFFSLLQKTSGLRGKKIEKKLAGAYVLFLIVEKLLTLLSKVSNHSRCINKIDNIRIIRYAKKRREKFDYRNLSRA